jgi:hypothetical protein
LANASNLGYRHFDSGFLLKTENLTKIMDLAYQQNQSGYWQTDIEIKITNLTIQFAFKKQDLTQNITLLYDKYTGLLQYACVNISNNPNIEFEINYFNPLIVAENITLIIEFYENTEIWANFSIFIRKKSVYDVLKKWCEVGYDDYGAMGYFITTINGEGGNWLYSVNGDTPGVAASKVMVKDNYRIKWFH